MTLHLDHAWQGSKHEQATLLCPITQILYRFTIRWGHVSILCARNDTADASTLENDP